MKPEGNLKRDLSVAIIITVVVLAIEIAGGIFSNSLALLSDASHVLTHIIALSLAWLAVGVCSISPTKRKTFGYHRAEIFTALINGFMLIGVAILIIYESYKRYLNPQEIHAGYMLVVAVIGLIGNLWVLFKLKEHKNLSVKGAFLHVLGDTLSSFIVIVGGIFIFFTDKFILDPILSIIVAIIVAISAIRLIKNSADILLEGVPDEISIDDIIKEIKTVKNVKGAHSIHVWSICSDVNAINAHIYTNKPNITDTEDIISDLNKVLSKRFNIKHSTFQFECKECKMPKKVKKIKH